MNIRTLLTIIGIIIYSVSFGQEYQTYKGGFKLKKEYKMETNTLLLQMANQQGINNIMASYLGSTDEESPTRAIIYNINVHDESSLFSKPNVQKSQVAKSYIDNLKKGLKSAGIAYVDVVVDGIPAIESGLDNNGVPSKALFLLKGKRAYFLQVTTRNNLSENFNRFKKAFSLL